MVLSIIIDRTNSRRMDRNVVPNDMNNGQVRSNAKNSEMHFGDEQDMLPYCESSEYPNAAIDTIVAGHLLRQFVHHINNVRFFVILCSLGKIIPLNQHK